VTMGKMSRIRSTRLAGLSTTPASCVMGDQLQRAVQMRAGLVMHAHPIGSRIGKRGNVVVGVFDHQVAIEGRLVALRRLLTSGGPA